MTAFSLVLIFIVSCWFAYMLEKNRQDWLRQSFKQENKPYHLIVLLEGWYGCFVAVYLDVKYFWYRRR